MRSVLTGYDPLPKSGVKKCCHIINKITKKSVINHVMTSVIKKMILNWGMTLSSVVTIVTYIVIIMKGVEPMITYVFHNVAVEIENRGICG